MRLRVRDLSTNMFPKPFALMHAWSKRNVDTIDFDQCKTIHVDRQEDYCYFKNLIEERKLSITLRWDEKDFLLGTFCTQHSWTFVNGKSTYHEITLVDGTVFWTKTTYNEMGLIKEIELSSGYVVTVGYDAQGIPVSVQANDSATEVILEQYSIEWNPESGVLDLRSEKIKQDEDSHIDISELLIRRMISGQEILPVNRP